WAYQRGVTLDFSRPGKPTDNAFIESFNGKFRAECLNAHWFMSLDDARRKCEAWRRDYNEERPHSAIGNKAPIELIDQQWHAARTDRNWLEKGQQAGPRMGSSSANLKLTFHLDHSAGAGQAGRARPMTPSSLSRPRRTSSSSERRRNEDDGPVGCADTDRVDAG